MNMQNETDFEAIFDAARKVVEKQSHYYDAIALKNTEKVITAFRHHHVSDFYMKPTTGYAYNDLGREKLDEIYAEVFGTEAALVRSQFVSGTHGYNIWCMGWEIPHFEETSPIWDYSKALQLKSSRGGRYLALLEGFCFSMPRPFMLAGNGWQQGN